MAYVEESIRDGKMYRECTSCKTDVTQETMWMRYKFCPWCGQKNEGIKYVGEIRNKDGT